MDQQMSILNPDAPLQTLLARYGWSVMPRSDRPIGLTIAHEMMGGQSVAVVDPRDMVGEDGEVYDQDHRIWVMIAGEVDLPLIVLDESINRLTDDTSADVGGLVYLHSDRIPFHYPVSGWAETLAALLGSQVQDSDTSKIAAKKAPGDDAVETTEERQGVRASGSDKVTLVSDVVSEVDLLGRQGVAVPLAKRLLRVWGTNVETWKKSTRERPARGAYVAHIRGPWGSGKSTIFRLVEKALREERKKSANEERVVCVNFNAWRNQHLRPPWWPLLEATLKDGMREVPKSRALAIRVWDWWWRFRTDRSHSIFAGGVVFAVVAILLWSYGSLETAATAAKWLSTIIALAGTIGGVAVGGARAVAWSSAEAVQTYLRQSRDPMEKISRHFYDLVRRLDQPVFIFVDDLDRCDAGYAVGLLEGIHTLYDCPGVVWVVASDRTWLWRCFEIQYSAFAKQEAEPGRPLGSRFVEKLFQLSIEVPRISMRVQEWYWDRLLRGDMADLESEVEMRRKEMRGEFRGDKIGDEIVKAATEPEADVLTAQLRREEAASRLADDDIEQETQHYLQAFASLLDPNPRAMKRLVNAYGMALATALASDIDVNTEERKAQLAKWTILSMRWPVLSEAIEDRPELIDILRRAETPPDGLPKDIVPLFDSERVREIVSSSVVQGELSASAVRVLIGAAAEEDVQSVA